MDLGKIDSILRIVDKHPWRHTDASMIQDPRSINGVHSALAGNDNIMQMLSNMRLGFFGQ